MPLIVGEDEPFCQIIREDGTEARQEINLYEVLGVKKDATAEEIEKAYQKMSLHYGSNNSPNDPSAADRFKAISYANAILSDPSKRQIYDEHGDVGLQVAEEFGDQNVDSYFCLNSIWCHGLFLLGGLLTGCYFCFCLCCCCGCCGQIPVHKEDEEGGEAITTQPPSTTTTQPSWTIPITRVVQTCSSIPARGLAFVCRCKK